MHSIEVGANSGPPAFLNKLWKLVEDSKYDNLISWGPDGSTFIIRNQPQFAKEVLPLYFKHNNMASFVRQLNMYGFRKVANIDQGGLKSEKDEMEFQHQFFMQGHEYLLPLIKRKISMQKMGENTPMKPDSVNKIILDVTQLKNKQESMDSKLASLKRENEVVWQEVASLRQKHAHQEQIINKMIQFLLSMVQRKGIPMKRKIPLMFKEPPLKRDGLSHHYTLDEDKLDRQTPNTSSGPVIHDVTDAVDNDPGQFLVVKEETIPADDEQAVVVDMIPESPEDIKQPLSALNLLAANSNVNSPAETQSTHDPLVAPVESEPLVGDCLLNDVLNCDIPSTSNMGIESELENENADSSTIAIPSKRIRRTELVEHVESIDNELDVLRELLSNSAYSIDASALMDFFNPEDSLPNASFTDDSDKNEITGNELIQYNPSLLELAEHNPTLSELAEDSEFFPSEPIETDSEFNPFDVVETGLQDEGDSGFSSSANPPSVLNTPDIMMPDPILPNVSFSRKRGRGKKST